MTPNFRVPVAFSLVLALTAPGFAQTTATPSASPTLAPSGPVASSGKRMPEPGVPKAGKQTRLDKREQQRMDKDMNICKGC